MLSFLCIGDPILQNPWVELNNKKEETVREMMEARVETDLIPLTLDEFVTVVEKITKDKKAV